jgi:hypothetical protein
LTKDESQGKVLTNPELSKLIGVSERTIQDWHKKLRNGGTIGRGSANKDIIEKFKIGEQWKAKKEGNNLLWYKESE